MNDEAHHVHGKKTARNEELVWRYFMGYLYERLRRKHSKERGLFMQIDYSATPFYGSSANREYFPHVVYDFDLVEAMRETLVKQLFLEERQSIAGERLDDLDFRAIRTEAEGRKRGEIKSLSPGQKLMLDIGRHKLEQFPQEFQERGLDRKPVMMVLAEETKVLEVEGIAICSEKIQCKSMAKPMHIPLGRDPCSLSHALHSHLNPLRLERFALLRKP